VQLGYFINQAEYLDGEITFKPWKMLLQIQIVLGKRHVRIFPFFRVDVEKGEGIIWRRTATV
jgi:hypothetical protein